MMIIMTDEFKPESSSELDSLTRSRFVSENQIDELVSNSSLLDKVTALSFLLGMITGIILASLLHKYIVHPLGF